MTSPFSFCDVFHEIERPLHLDNAVIHCHLRTCVAQHLGDFERSKTGELPAMLGSIPQPSEPEPF